MPSRDRLPDDAIDVEQPLVVQLSRDGALAAIAKDAGLPGIATTGVADASELLEMAVEEGDEATLQGVESDIQRLEQKVRGLELRRMFSGPMDSHSAFLDIQAGAGGTESNDWADILYRMYNRWAERRGFETELMDVQPGDTVEVRGPLGRWFTWDGTSPALLVGGGSGVVPLMAMLRWARAADHLDGLRRSGGV